MKRARQISGGLFVGITGFSVILILAIIVVILVVIILGGKDRLTWEFLTSFPENGMMEGGIFPAIYGTALMVILCRLPPFRSAPSQRFT